MAESLGEGPAEVRLHEDGGRTRADRADDRAPAEGAAREIVSALRREVRANPRRDYLSPESRVRTSRAVVLERAAVIQVQNVWRIDSGEGDGGDSGSHSLRQLFAN